MVLSFYYPNQFCVAWGRKEMDAVFICKGFISHTRLWKHDCSNELGTKVTNKDFSRCKLEVFFLVPLQTYKREERRGKKALSEACSQLLQAEGLWGEISTFPLKCYSACSLSEYHLQCCPGKASLGQKEGASPAQTAERLCITRSHPSSPLHPRGMLWKHSWNLCQNLV